MNNLLKNMLISLFTALTSCQTGEIIDVTQNNNLDNIIKSEFKRLQMPGLAYAAVKNDSVVYMGTEGYADIEKKIAFTERTRFTVASSSKAVLVTAFMQLFERDLFTLDDDINRYLPFDVRNPHFPDDTITIRMLLTHTSSISDKNYSELAFYLYGYVDYPESLVSFLKNYLTEGGSYYHTDNYYAERPGTRRDYSNIDAGLIAAILEYITGSDFNTYCKEHIFNPLGMTKTTWLFSETPKDEVAVPYFDKNWPAAANPYYTFPTYPDGHLTTTIEDFSKFLRAYTNGGTFNGYQLLKPETIALMFQPHFVSEGRFKYQGLIFYREETGGRTVWAHGGGDWGTSTDSIIDDKNNTGCIIFNNRWPCYSETIRCALLQYADR